MATNEAIFGESVNLLNDSISDAIKAASNCDLLTVLKRISESGNNVGNIDRTIGIQKAQPYIQAQNKLLGDVTDILKGQCRCQQWKRR